MYVLSYNTTYRVEIEWLQCTSNISSFDWLSGCPFRPIYTYLAICYFAEIFIICLTYGQNYNSNFRIESLKYTVCLK